MTRIGRPAALACLLLAVAGCGPTATATATAPLPDEVFAAALTSQGIDPSQERLAQGRAVCTLLTDGRTPPEVASALVTEAGVDQSHVGYVITAAVRIFCPQHQQALDEFTRSAGGS